MLRKVLRKKYYPIAAVIVLVTFIVVWRMAGIGEAVFSLAIVVTVLFFLSFNPRIKRDW